MGKHKAQGLEGCSRDINSPHDPNLLSFLCLKTPEGNILIWYFIKVTNKMFYCLNGIRFIRVGKYKRI